MKRKRVEEEFTKVIVFLTIFATLLLTVSALTQDSFAVNSDDEVSDSKNSKSESDSEEVIVGSVEEAISDVDSTDKDIKASPEEETIVEIELTAMQKFLNSIKLVEDSDVELSDIKQIAKDTKDEAPPISKKTKEIAIAEVTKKAITSNKVDIIVWVKKGSSYKAVMNGLRNFEKKYTYDKLNGFSGKATRETINQLKADKRIDYLAFDAPVKANLDESVPLIKADLVSNNYNLRGEGMGVCHLDTGINYNIPELAHAYAGGYDFVNNDNDPFDDNGHGTVTAGVIVSNNPTNTGVAPNSKLYVAKVLDASGFGFSSSVTAGINWCIVNKDLFNLSVISMSIATFETYNRLNSPGYSDVALQAAYNANIPVVACTGNTGNMTGVAYPAVSPYVIPVSGVYDSDVGQFNYNFGNFSCSDNATAADKMACFANRADFVDLVAPASIITTTSWFGGAIDISGTSVASPHVVGTIALMKQRNSQMTIEQIKEILINTGVTIQDTVTGLTFHRINALEAVKAVPYTTTTGTLAAGNIINVEVSDPMNPGMLYFSVLSFGNDYGIPLSNGLTLPLNPDGLFTYSLSPNPLIINNIGFLDNNGKANVTIFVPPIQGIENFTLYTGFATARTDLSEFLSVSNSVTL